MFSGSFGLVEANLEKLMKNEFVLAFKKISKRDEMTKKKGLKELKVLSIFFSLNLLIGFNSYLNRKK
jgi:hypothetical protein